MTSRNRIYEELPPSSDCLYEALPCASVVQQDYVGIATEGLMFSLKADYIRRTGVRWS